MFMQPEESTIEPKQQEPSMLEESNMVHEDIHLMKSKRFICQFHMLL